MTNPENQAAIAERRNACAGGSARSNQLAIGLEHEEARQDTD